MGKPFFIFVPPTRNRNEEDRRKTEKKMASKPLEENKHKKEDD